MPVETTWLIDRRVIHKYYHGVLTLDEYVQTTQETVSFSRQTEPPFHGVVDLLDLTSWPNFTELNQVARHEPMPGAAWIVLIVREPSLRTIAIILAGFIHPDVAMFETREEAIAFLLSHDPTLELPTGDR